MKKALLALIAIALLAARCPAGADATVRAGSELDFRPYAFTDKAGQATGFGVELLKAVADRMGLRLQISPARWNAVWGDLVAGRLDVLPVVARTPGREPLVDFSQPHTETYDAFFVRAGQPAIRDLAAAAGREIVVLRDDAAHHQLVERKFAGAVVPVASIAEGMRLVASGRHDALLCSKLIGTLEVDEHDIRGVRAGPPIPDYKRVFSFAVRKGHDDLRHKLDEGLRIVKADGEYDRLYAKWLGPIEPPPGLTVLWQVLGVFGSVVFAVVAWLLARRALAADDRSAQDYVPSSRWVRYSLAAAAVATGYAMRVGLEAWVGQGLPPYITFFPAVMVSALLGGLGPGVLATGAASLVTFVWVLPAAGHPVLASPVHALGMGLFAGTGLLMSAVAELYRRNRIRAAAFDRAEAVRDSEALLRAVIDGSPDPIYLKDSGSRLLLANPATFALIGRPEEDCLGRTDEEFYEDPDDGRAIMENDRRIMASGRPETVEETVHTPSGPRHYLSTKVPRRDGTGSVVGLIGVTRDITAARKADAERERLLGEVRAERDRVEALVASMHDEVWFADADGRLTLVNSAVQAEYGAGEAGDGDTVAASFGARRPDGVPGPLDEAPPRRALAGEVVVGHEETVRVPGTGELRYRQVNAAPVRDQAGRIIGSVSVVRDVTESKRTEQALRASRFALEEAQRIAGIGSWTWDARTDETTVSQEFLRIFGRADCPAFQQQRGTMYPPEAWDRLAAAVAETLRTGIGCHLDVEALRADRSPIWVTTRSEAVREPDGTVVGLRGTVQDITERKRAEAKVQQLNARLERAMAETHHRVKNNLQTIGALIDMLQMAHEAAVPPAEIERLGRHVRGLATIHDLLTQEARAHGDAEFLSVREALSKLRPLLENMAGGRELRFHLDDLRLPMRQATGLAVLANALVSNAVKHGAGAIDLSLAVADGTAHLTVRDHGKGFPEGFDAVAAASTGLELVQSVGGWDLGGKLEFTNAYGGGACVTVRFPVTAPANGGP